MENFLINIFNTTLFSLLVLINIVLCFAVGEYFLKKTTSLGFNYQISLNKNTYIAVIIGFIIICSFLSLINLFLKINYLIFIILFVICLFPLAKNKSNFLIIKEYKTYAVYLIIILFLSKISMISYFASDTGYYHIPVIKIYNDHNTIFGLANLFPQYGFNNLNFYYSAMITANPFLLRFFSVPTVVFFFITSLYIFSCRKEYKNKFTFLILLGGHFYINAKYLSSIAPDFYVNCLCLVIFSEIYIQSIVKKNISDQSLLQIIFLSIIIITIKLSSIFFSLSIISFLLTFYRKNFLSYKFIRFFILIFILLIIFFSKNILYSGSLLFPTGIGTFDLLWSVPKELSLNFLSWVKSFARNPNSVPEEVLLNYEWIYIWFQNTDKIFLLSIFSSIFIYLLNLLAYPKEIILKNKKLNYLIIIYFFSIIFWFLNAPDTRFSLMLNVFLFLLVIDINLIYKEKLNNLFLKLSIPAIYIVFIYAFIYLNFINIYLNHQKLVFKNGWRSISKHEFKLKDYEKINGLNFYFIEGYCWFKKTLCTTEGKYFNYKTKVKKFNNNFIIYLKK